MNVERVTVLRMFHAKSRRRVFVKLPPEDATEGMCGLLLKSMYGTRDAAQNWEFEYADFMIAAGFKRGESCGVVL